MCFQGFAHFKCGHTTLHDEICESAAQLELPFFNKLQCENYDIASRRPALDCGIGKFYCAQTPDGQYLDDIFRHNRHVDDRISEIDQVVATRLDPMRAEIAHRIRRECDNNRALMDQVVMQDPQALKVNKTLQEGRQQKAALLARKKAGEDTIQYARQFWLLHAHNVAIYGTPGMLVVKPPLPPYLRQFPNSIGFNQGFGDMQAVPKPSFAPVPLAFPGNGGMGLMPPRNAVQLAKGISQPAGLGVLLAGQKRKQQLEEQNYMPEVEAVSRRQVRSKRVKEEVSQEPPESVRRSSRVRGKKINYAEDANSEISSPSRPASPVKSDISAFSPDKSDASASYNPSPVRKTRKDKVPAGRVTRGGSSLGEMIKKWKTAGMPHLQSAGGSQQSPQSMMPGSAGPGTPDTVILGQNDQRADAPISGAPRANIQQSWLVNTGDADPTLSPDHQRDDTQLAYGVPRGPVLPPNFTSDSALQRPLMGFNYPNATPRHLSYGPATPLLRSNSMTRIRSNLAGSPLVPSPQVPYQAPFGSTDPTKRQISASSPGMAPNSNKRIRLSLPGEGLRRDSMTAPATPPVENDAPYPAPYLHPPGASQLRYQAAEEEPAGEFALPHSVGSESADLGLTAPEEEFPDFMNSKIDWDLFEGRSMA